MTSLARNAKQSSGNLVSKTKSSGKALSPKKSFELKLKVSFRDAHLKMPKDPSAGTSVSFAETRVLHDLSGYGKAFAIRDKHLRIDPSFPIAKKKVGTRKG